MKFWIKNGKKFQIVSLSLFAFSASFSISISQFFIFMALVTWLVDLFILKKIKNKGLASVENSSDIKDKNHEMDEKTEYELKDFVKKYSKIRWHPYFAVIIAWVLLRVVEIFLSENPLKETIQFREIWLISLVPIMAFRISGKKEEFYFVLALCIGGALTGFFNLYQYNIKSYDIMFRAGGFNSYHHLTYAGITGVIFFISLGHLFNFIKEKNKVWIIIFLILSVGILTGLLLTRSRGSIIAIFLTFGFLLFIIFRKYFILFLPFLIILPLFLFKNTPKLQLIFERAFNPRGQEFFSLQERIYLWQAGARMWLHNPLLGTGAADYGRQYQKFKHKGATGVAKAGSHMHNDLLNTLVLYGTVGLSIFLLIYFLPIFHFLKYKSWIYDNYNQNNRKWILIGLICAIFMFIAQGLSQCHFTDEEVQVTLWIAVGLFYRNLNELTG